ncbi:MAG: peroxidase family protein [Gammaproteobacteria bacterium]
MPNSTFGKPVMFIRMNPLWMAPVLALAILSSVATAAVEETSSGSNAANVTEVSSSRGVQRAGRPNLQNDPGHISGSYRSYSGQGNNIENDEMGMAETALVRWTQIDYADGMQTPNDATLPSPRLISNLVFDQAYSKPNDNNASDFLWQWGQFLDHDIDLTDGIDPPEPLPIQVPTGDPWFDPDSTGTQSIPFNRSIYDLSTGGSTDNPRLQVNEISSWIDASNVYGSNPVRALELRTNDGTGRLKSSEGDFLPYNVNGFPNAGGSGSELFLSGDVRANEQLGLTAMHTLFMREHNRLADMLATENPQLGGEEIYQKARRMVGGIVQYITYEEFLPTLLGANALPPYSGYNANKNAAISNVFSTAAYRFGHSTLSPQLLRVDAGGEEYFGGHLDLRDAFFSPVVVTEPGSLDAIFRGLSSQVCQSVDAFVIDDIRNFLFGPPGAGGLDLVSLNIQRGREHGIGRYNPVRIAMGLSPKSSVEDITSDPVVAFTLSSAYSSIDDIDVWVGGLAEDHMPGAMVGEFLYRTIRKQFIALRDGDRFWYQYDMNARELAIVESSTLAEVIRRNTNVGEEMSDNVFIVANLPDSDGDGVEDIRDNCLAHANELQIDADNDGFGNRCDTDINNDGRTNFGDLAIFSSHYLQEVPVSDFNSDGVVNGVDLTIFRDQFLQQVGPSGLHQ